MRPPAIMAHPFNITSAPAPPEPQDLKCNWQEDVKESGDVVSILHPHLHRQGGYNGDVLPSALKGRSGSHFGGEGYADTDLVSGNVDGVSLALA